MYKKLDVIGHGTFGTVYRAINEETGHACAIKKIRSGNVRDGISFTALREIKVLQDLHHKNIVPLLDVQARKFSIHLIFEFMPIDLYALINDRSVVFSLADIKGMMKMLLDGIEYCHSHWILHRDLKPSNLLFSSDGVLHIGDFGLSRAFGNPAKVFTSQVVTRWYRAPELLFGARLYSSPIDMWACGCILAEMLLRVPYFAGDTDLDQLSKIFSALGTPSEEVWPGVSKLPNYVQFAEFPATPFKQIFTAASEDCIDLIAGLLRYDPNTRLTASQALNHPFFHRHPLPSSKERISSVISPLVSGKSKSSKRKRDHN